MTAPLDSERLPPDDDDDPFAAALRAAYSPAESSRHSPGNPPSVLGILRERTGAALGEPTATGPSAERYRMLGELARGGVGVVFRGRDVDLGRDVAMKLLHQGSERDVELLQRFVEEAQIGGQLQHPGIVPIYELGLQGGERPFIAMKLVDGETLAKRLQERPSLDHDRHRFLTAFERVCETVAYAHARDVIHRDLKPANVMLGAFGEVMVLDWGFAKVLGKPSATPAPRASVTTRRSADESAHSLQGSVMGTPAYMPPEQARGQVDQLDARADVFSLGAVLCEILTGRPAYTGSSAETMRRAVEGDLTEAHATLAASDADPALVALARACLQAEPAHRPVHASELAERLRQHRGSVEERARAAELQVARAQVRARATKVLAATITLGLALGAGAWLAVQSAVDARRADAAQRVSSALQSARELFGQAEGSLDAEHWELVVAAAEKARALAASPDAAAAARAQVQELDELARQRRAAAQSASATRARDAAMRARLETLRVPADEDTARPGWEQREALRLDAGYAAAFTEWGHPLGELVDDATSARASAIRPELAVAFDHWATARHVLERAGAAPAEHSASALRTLAIALDPDDAWRARLRSLLAALAAPPALEPLRDLAAEPQLTEQPPLSVFLLGDALLKVNATEAAIATFERGAQRYPGDFLLTFWLGIARQRMPDPDTVGALDALRVARALRPDMLEVLHRAGMVHEWRGDLPRALAMFEELARAQPNNAHWLEHVGRTLVRMGRAPEGVAVHRRAVELSSNSASTHAWLGASLMAIGDEAEAMACLQRALELSPDYAPAHFELGMIYADRDEHDAALASLQRAHELSGAPEHLWSVAKVRMNQGDLDGAITTFRSTVERDPRFAEGHHGLGMAQRQRGDVSGAIASQRAAVALMPRRAKYHAELGAALLEAEDLAGAEAALRQALALKPDFAEVYGHLGSCLLRQGRSREALEALRRCDELGRAKRSWPHPSAEWVATAEAAVQRHAQLNALALGERAAASSAEWLEAAEQAVRDGALELAARTYGAAFAAHAELLTDAERGLALTAAGVALRAAGDARAHVEARSALRCSALRWLRQALDAWRPHLSAGGTAAAALLVWSDAPALASVRAPEGQAALPPAEAAAWRALWNEVAELRANR